MIIWSSLKTWLGLHDLVPRDWHGIDNVKDWWMELIHRRGDSRKALDSLTMLVAWEIWLEGNTRVFSNKSSTAPLLIEKLKRRQCCGVVREPTCCIKLCREVGFLFGLDRLRLRWVM